MSQCYFSLNMHLKLIEYFLKCSRPKFRSYKPQDEGLQEAKLEDAVPVSVDEEVKDLLEAGKEKVSLGIFVFNWWLHSESLTTLAKEFYNRISCFPILYNCEQTFSMGHQSFLVILYTFFAKFFLILFSHKYDH